MNIQNLMAQAQRVQKDLERANNEIENTVFEGVSGAVKVTISGKHEVKSVVITDDSVLSDKEMLEDMILIAVNDGLKKISKMKEEKMGKYTGDLGGLF